MFTDRQLENNNFK